MLNNFLGQVASILLWISNSFVQGYDPGCLNIPIYCRIYADKHTATYTYFCKLVKTDQICIITSTSTELLPYLRKSSRTICILRVFPRDKISRETIPGNTPRDMSQGKHSLRQQPIKIIAPFNHQTILTYSNHLVLWLETTVTSKTHCYLP